MTRLTQAEKTLVAVTAAYITLEVCAHILALLSVFVYMLIGAGLGTMLICIKTFNDPKG